MHVQNPALAKFPCLSNQSFINKSLPCLLFIVHLWWHYSTSFMCLWILFFQVKTPLQTTEDNMVASPTKQFSQSLSLFCQFMHFSFSPGIWYRLPLQQWYCTVAVTSCNRGSLCPLPQTVTAGHCQGYRQSGIVPWQWPAVTVYGNHWFPL